MAASAGKPKKPKSPPAQPAAQGDFANYTGDQMRNPSPDDIRMMAQHVHNDIDAASPEHYDAGLHWYDRAHEFAGELSKRYGVSHEQAAGVISSFSPQTDWAANKHHAEIALRSGPDSPDIKFATSTMRGNAARIMGGEQFKDVLSYGRKTHAFAENIVNPHGRELGPGELDEINGKISKQFKTVTTGQRELMVAHLSHPATVDRHAIRTLANNDTVSSQTTSALQDQRSYASMSAPFHAVAADRGILVPAAQAIPWVYRRGGAD